MAKKNEYPYALYSAGDCISEHETFEDAENAFVKEVTENPENEVDVLSADGETTYLSYDPETGEVYKDEHRL